MTLEEFIEGAKDHDDIMDMLKKMMDLTPVLIIIVEGRTGWERRAGGAPGRKDYNNIINIYNYNNNQPSVPIKKREKTCSTPHSLLEDTWCFVVRTRQRETTGAENVKLYDGLWLAVQPLSVRLLLVSGYQVEKQTNLWRRYLKTLMILFSCSHLDPSGVQQNPSSQIFHLIKQRNMSITTSQSPRWRLQKSCSTWPTVQNLKIFSRQS